MPTMEKKTLWGPKGHQRLLKKGTGLSLHVSDFITDVGGRLKFGDELACEIIKPGTNRDGWWKCEDLAKQVEFKAIPIFNKLYPDAVGVFAFDNAKSHGAFAKNALIAERMNMNPGGKSEFRDGVMPDGSIQKMHYEDGRPKGIKIVLEERGLWQEGLFRICAQCKEHQPTRDNCCAVRILSLQDDFKATKPVIQEIVERHGHKIIFYPKFHCELNFMGCSKEMDKGELRLHL